MIDLHCHVLPGIDDGPPTIEESVALIRAADTTGIRTMVATPHVNWRYQNEAHTIAQLTGELNERLRNEEIAVEIRPGAEIAMTRAMEIEPQEIARLSLGGGAWVLLEPPFAQVAPGLEELVIELQDAGRRVLLAHPERCPAFLRKPGELQAIVRAGALSSITAGSLVGRFGGEVRRFARHLVEERLVHNVASDAHDVMKRPPGMATELIDAGLEGLSDWLTREVPEAILNGTEVPPRPALATSHGGRRLPSLRRHRH